MNPDRSDAGYRLRLHYTKLLSQFEFVAREAVSQLAAGHIDTVTLQLARLATMTCGEHQNAVAASIATGSDINALVAVALSSAKASRDVTTRNHLSDIVTSRTRSNNKLPDCTCFAASLPRVPACVAIGVTSPFHVCDFCDNGDIVSVKCGNGKRKISLIPSAPTDAAPEHQVTQGFSGPCNHTLTLHAIHSNRDAHTPQQVDDESAAAWEALVADK